jgi:MYXO-CTERM domain-containing protein
MHEQTQTMQFARCLVLCAVLLATLVMARSARAYSTGTVASDACHEQITQAALREARQVLGEGDAVSPSDNERALIDDLPFELAGDLRDLGAATLVLSNHWVDFRGNQPSDLDRIAPLHGDPDHQREHCLRTSSQDGTEGSKAALLECRAFIREKVEAALDGLDADGHVDAHARTQLRVALDIRGSVDASLPTFHVQMGQALHTIQDGFSHTFRTEDHREVVTVLNYIEFVEDRLDPVDGPAHRSPLDECKHLDTLRQERLGVATSASQEFLEVALDPALSKSAKLARTDALLDEYFSHTDGCDAENGYCDAPEAKYQNQTTGCQCATQTSSASWPSGLGPLALGGMGLLRRRRRAGRGHRRASWALATLIAIAAALVSSVASAQAETPNSADPPATDPVARQAVAKEDARIENEDLVPWGAALNLSGSLQNPAVAAALGARYRLSEHWLVGLDGEYNPWYADETGKFRPGVFSAYASVIVRFPMRFERTNLRSTLELGASSMLFDLYGVPKGTTGPFVGLNLLGLDIELGRQFYLVVNPAHIAVPVPQTQGAPFSYVQYRITLGLQWGA